MKSRCHPQILWQSCQNKVYYTAGNSEEQEGMSLFHVAAQVPAARPLFPLPASIRRPCGRLFFPLFFRGHTFVVYFIHGVSVNNQLITHSPFPPLLPAHGKSAQSFLLLLYYSMHRPGACCLPFPARRPKSPRRTGIACLSDAYIKKKGKGIKP